VATNVKLGHFDLCETFQAYLSLLFVHSFITYYCLFILAWHPCQAVNRWGNKTLITGTNSLYIFHYCWITTGTSETPIHKYGRHTMTHSSASTYRRTVCTKCTSDTFICT